MLAAFGPVIEYRGGAMFRACAMALDQDLAWLRLCRSVSPATLAPGTEGIRLLLSPN